MDEKRKPGRPKGSKSPRLKQLPREPGEKVVTRRIFLTESELEWLKARGGISPGVRALIVAVKTLPFDLMAKGSEPKPAPKRVRPPRVARPRPAPAPARACRECGHAAHSANACPVCTVRPCPMESVLQP